MPFDPDKFLAEKQVELAPEQSPKGFDPDAFLADASAVDAAKPSVADSAGRAASQGATAGFGDEISAGVSALIPTATDEALGRSFTDRYAASRDAIRNENALAEKAHPVVSALTEIATSAPLAIATGGGGLAALTAQGAIYGLGKSKKETLGEAAKDTAVSGLLSLGLGAAIPGAKQFIKELPEAGLNRAVTEFGDEIATRAPKLIEDKAGNLTIKYGAGLKESAQVGRDMQAALHDPNVQAQITSELNAQPQRISSLINETKSELGKSWDPLIKEHGAASADVNSALKESYSRVNDIGVAKQGDPVRAGLKADLLEKMDTVSKELLAQSPTGKLEDIPLLALAQSQEQLGRQIFKQKIFAKDSTVNGAAKSFFHSIKDAFVAADKKNGSGGSLGEINKVFAALYEMEGANSKIAGSTLKGLADPQNTSARKAYDRLIKPVLSLDPKIREALTPKINAYLSNDFQKAVTKAQVMHLVTGRGAQNKDAASTIFSLAGIKGASKGALNDIANRFGAMTGGPAAPPPAFNVSLPDASKTLNTALPALTAPNEKE